MRKVTKADLQRRLMELEAQLASSYHFANASLDKFQHPNLIGGGVLLRIDSLGGQHSMNPVVIRDGLSREVIEALRKDLQRSFIEATELKP